MLTRLLLRPSSLLAALFTAGIVGAAGAQVTVDESLPDYEPIDGVSGSLKSVGSDTMNNLMALWTEGFKRFYPNVTVEVEGKGSSTAPAALIEGTANFGPMSRPMRQKEIDDFEQRFGYKPTELAMGIDMLAVYVHKDNPLQAMTLPQVDAVFSSTRRLGHGQDITLWGQLGLEGRWAQAPISLYGRNSASGTYGFFKEHALGRGDFRNEVKEQPGSSSVVQGVANDLYAIGYSGIGYITADVKAVALAVQEGDEPVTAEGANAYSGEYPLSRFLLVYINHRPGSDMDPLRREFIRYVYSRQGQEETIKDGYFPVSAEMARAALLSVGIEPGF